MGQLSKIDICPQASLAAIENAKWQVSAELSSELDNGKIGDALLLEANKADLAGNLPLAHSIACVAHAVRIYLDASDWNVPYKPFFVAENSRGAEVADFSDEHLAILKCVVGNTDNPVIKSRLSDILWLKTKDINYANAAIESFASTVEQVIAIDKMEFSRHQKEAKRAVQLWIQTGSDEAIRIEALFVRGLFLDEPEPDNFLREIVLSAASESAIFEKPLEWVTKSTELSESSHKQKNYRKAREYLECAINFAKQAKDDSIRKSLLAQQTDLYEVEAEEMKAAGAALSMLQHLYFAAIETNQAANKIIGGRREKINALHVKLNEIQPEVLSTMAPIAFDLDLTDQLKKVREELKRHDLHKGLALLSTLTTPISKSKYLADAEDLIKQSPIRHLFAGVGFDNRGRVVTRSSGMSLDDKKTQEATILREATMHWKLWLMGQGNLVDRGRFDLLYRFENIESVFDPFLECNPFVPKDRIGFFRQGLVAGLRGDWLISMHILVPQIENSIRNFMETVGVLVTTLDEDLIQQERDLNGLLYRPAIASAFDENAVFQLRSLFTEKIGFNFRNLLAHGLVGREYFSGGMNYLAAFVWAHVIYLCITTRAVFFSELTRRSTDPDSSKAEEVKTGLGL
jgi:hypothetical protein